MDAVITALNKHQLFGISVFKNKCSIQTQIYDNFKQYFRKSSKLLNKLMSNLIRTNIILVKQSQREGSCTLDHLKSLCFECENFDEVVLD